MQKDSEERPGDYEGAGKYIVGVPAASHLAVLPAPLHYRALHAQKMKVFATTLIQIDSGPKRTESRESVVEDRTPQQR